MKPTKKVIKINDKAVELEIINEFDSVSEEQAEKYKQ